MKNASNEYNRVAIGLTLALSGFLYLAAPAVGQDPRDTQVALAESLLPASARGKAKIVVRDATGEVVIRKGDGFICVSDSSRPGRLSLNCHQEALQEQLDLEREVALEGFRGKEFTQQLCKQADARGVVVPDGTIEISASVGVEPDSSLPYEMTVYYLLWLPLATTASIGIVDENPGDGSPWLHKAGTCQAHVMWSEQRPIPDGSANTAPGGTAPVDQVFAQFYPVLRRLQEENRKRN